MKKTLLRTPLLRTLCIALCVLGFSRIALAENFILHDVPAMQDMWAGETITLDNQGDSIVQVVASTPSTKQAITDYYTNALPNFGWKKSSSDTYKRGAETLRISILDSDADGTTVEFSLISQ